jgi:hypothetical protein
MVSKDQFGRVRHEWSKWFSQKKFILKRGEDFTCEPYVMGNQVRNNATMNGLKVSVKIGKESVTVEVV